MKSQNDFCFSMLFALRVWCVWCGVTALFEPGMKSWFSWKQWSGTSSEPWCRLPQVWKISFLYRSAVSLVMWHITSCTKLGTIGHLLNFMILWVFLLSVSLKTHVCMTDIFLHKKSSLSLHNLHDVRPRL